MEVVGGLEGVWRHLEGAWEVFFRVVEGECQDFWGSDFVVGGCWDLEVRGGNEGLSAVWRRCFGSDLE